MKILLIILAINLNIKLQPKQIELYNLVAGDQYSWIGYGGSRGGAKSHGVRDIGLILCSEIPGLKVAIFRRLSDDLEENHVIPLLAKYPELRQYFNYSKFILKLPNGSMMFFNYAQYEQDIYSYQGKEYDIINVDEATHFTQPMIEYLKTCNRSPKELIKAKMVLTMNPGNVGHVFIKRIFIDKSYVDNEKPEDYVFVPAKVHDNVMWVMNTLAKDGISIKEYYEEWTDEQRFDYTLINSTYAQDLAHLPEELKKAHLYGDWDIFGGMFFKTFNKRSQVIKPFAIPKEWEMGLSVDPGYSSPCSVGITARDLSNNYYRVATYYEAGKSPQQHLEGVKDWIETLKQLGLINKNPEICVAGRDAWAKKDRYSIMANELTFADVWNAGGIYLHPAITDRIPGWWTWKGLMPSEDNPKGTYFIFEGHNEDLINEMASVVSDPKRPEDILGRGNDPAVLDHALDEQRYGIMSLFKPMEPVKEPPKPTGREEAAMNLTEIDYARY